MIIYKNIGLDNIRKKKKNEKRINTFGDVIQKDPSDRLNISPYSFLRPRTASKKSPLAKL
jgi:hypothetical protein